MLKRGFNWYRTQLGRVVGKDVTNQVLATIMLAFFILAVVGVACIKYVKRNPELTVHEPMHMSRYDHVQQVSLHVYGYGGSYHHPHYNFYVDIIYRDDNGLLDHRLVYLGRDSKSRLRIFADRSYEVPREQRAPHALIRESSQGLEFCEIHLTSVYANDIAEWVYDDSHFHYEEYQHVWPDLE